MEAKTELDKLLSEFDNGIELFEASALFNKSVQVILRGGNMFKLIEQIIVMHEEQTKHYSDMITKGVIRQEIVVSKERFDELLKTIKTD